MKDKMLAYLKRKSKVLAVMVVLLMIAFVYSIIGTDKAGEKRDILKYKLSLIDEKASNLNSVPFSTPIMTYRDNIYVCYINDSLDVIVAKKDSGSDSWVKNKIHSKNTNDAHNICSIGIDKAGYIHVSFDMHAQPLRYLRSEIPEDISSFEIIDKMTGVQEDLVSYPHFYHSPSGELWFLYRNSIKENNGDDICLKKYDIGEKNWIDEFCPLIDGINNDPPFTPYEYSLRWDSSGNMHLFWNPRSISNTVMNFNVYYAKYSSGTGNWEKANAEKIDVPMKLNGDLADGVSPDQGLANQNSNAIDSLDRPHVAYIKDVSKDVSEIFHAYFDGQRWKVRQATSLGLKKKGRLWSLGRPQIIITPEDDLYIFFTDSGNSRAKNFALPPSNLYFTKSSDFGESWTEPQLLDIPKSGEFVYDYRYFVETGTARFFYQTTYSASSPLYVLDIYL